MRTTNNELTRRIDNILRGDTEAARQIQEYKDYKYHTQSGTL